MVIIWGTFITSWEKVIISWGKLITFGVNYHYRLASVQDLKSTKKILAGVRPPPLFGNAKILKAPIIPIGPLLHNLIF